MKKLLALLVAALLIVCASLALAEPVAIKALILPKFESGEMAGDFPGEAQYYYEGYCEGGESYDIVGCPNPLYVKDGVALCVTGMGKVNSAMTLQAILMDDRFDFSNAYIVSTGCAGSAIEYGVMGDVFVITATVDFDLGHHADARDLTTDLATTWFHDESYDDASAKLLNQELCEKVFNLVKDVQIETTEKTRAFMAGCPDPYALTEMEDHAMAVVLDRLGMLDRYIIIRDSVNTDVFMNGASPESLWDPNFVDSLASESSVESADIFATAMKNNFTVGHVVIDAILNGEL